MYFFAEKDNFRENEDRSLSFGTVTKNVLRKGKSDGQKFVENMFSNQNYYREPFKKASTTTQREILLMKVITVFVD